MHQGLLQSVAVSSTALDCVWLRSGESSLLVPDTAQMSCRTRPRPSASRQLLWDISGLHMVVYFNIGLLCTEAVWRNHVKHLCIKRLKPTYVNSGFQPHTVVCVTKLWWHTQNAARERWLSMKQKWGRLNCSEWLGRGWPMCGKNVQVPLSILGDETNLPTT